LVIKEGWFLKIPAFEALFHLPDYGLLVAPGLSTLSSPRISPYIELEEIFINFENLPTIWF